MNLSKKISFLGKYGQITVQNCHKPEASWCCIFCFEECDFVEETMGDSLDDVIDKMVKLVEKKIDKNN